jgi:hypothetical protein
MQDQDASENSKQLPQTQAVETDDSPKFGRLLIVLALAVLLMAVITFASEAFYS